MKLRWLLILIAYLPTVLWADEALDGFLTTLNTLRANFEQKLFNEKGSLVETSRGEMHVQRPGKFRWDYRQPYSQLIVADGEKVWIYDSDLEQVTVKTLDNALGKTPALLLSSYHKVEEDFFVSTLPPQAELTRFELIPKDAQAQFESIRLGLREKILKNIELKDNLGQTTSITFTDVQLNQPLDKGLFTFKPPAGTDVIEDK